MENLSKIKQSLTKVQASTERIKFRLEENKVAAGAIESKV